MNKKRILLLAVAAWSAGVFAHAPKAATLPDTPAVKAMQSGDYAEALKLLPAETAANPKDTALKQLYGTLKRVTQQEAMFAQETNPESALKTGRALRSFYYARNHFDKALAVDQKLYELAPGEATLAALGATELNLDKNKEAAATFGKMDLAKASNGIRLCAALAAARTGDTERARKILATVDSTKFKSNSERLLHCRVLGVLGDSAAVGAAVAKLMEQTPADEHAGLKKHIEASSDFKSVGAAAFRKALETPSQVKEEDCANCPNRAAGKCKEGKNSCDGDCK